MSAIEGVADRVEALLQERPDKEMSTDDIGGLVMDDLRASTRWPTCGSRP